ncbi:MAG: precorrin-6y C5,15-methyltransferase (decarboxylating) subunit CbiE [Bacillota bacterium]
MNKIYILGIGPGNQDYLLTKTKDIIRKSDVLIGGKRALAMFSDFEKEKIKITADLKKVKDYIIANYKEKRISVLVSGDPGFYSMLSYLKKNVNKDLLEVIPGISSLQLASARLKMSWDDMKISSLHGKSDKNKFLKEVRENKKLGIFTDNNFPPDQIASYLLKKGIENKNIVVFENLSYSNEKIIKGNLQEIKDKNFGKLNVMVIYDEKMGL